MCVPPIPITTQVLQTCLEVKLSWILTISLQPSCSYLVTESLCCSHAAGRAVISFHQWDGGTQGLDKKPPHGASYTNHTPPPTPRKCLHLKYPKGKAAFALLIAYCICSYFCKTGWPNRGLLWFFLNHEEQGKVTYKYIYIYIYKKVCIPPEKIRVVMYTHFFIPINVHFITDLHKALPDDRILHYLQLTNVLKSLRWL